MTEQQSNSEYRVLARKYRPSNFSDLIGHDAMVRTLSNALKTDRLAHAFILTGTRGIGKTTTARIIARGLNCVGADGNGGPTIDPCGVCDNCIAIAEDRHQDVLEMDAASRTGVEGIRELIDGVRYLPVAARFKIYIIDEVHMLSTAAFNALLKTLEEPPEHVKFIFATTEIRKIPVTVLSRCQRFDLKRIDAEMLADYLKSIAAREKAEITDDAVAMIARAAEGSVRDGLSLLDQGIAHGDGSIDANQVRDMLGLADRSQMLDLIGHVLSGDIKAALELLRRQYDSGADPIVIIQDLLELTHWLTSLKVTPEEAGKAAIAGAEAARGKEMAGQLSMPVLARTWQMLLKGLNEVRNAPMPVSAAEMILIRLAYVSDQPSPEEAIRKLEEGGYGASEQSGSMMTPSASSSPSASHVSPVVGVGGTAMARSMPDASPVQDTSARAHLSVVPKSDPLPIETPQPAIEPEPISKIHVVQSLQDVVALMNDRQHIGLKGDLVNYAHLVSFEKGRITLNYKGKAPSDFILKLGDFLKTATGFDWKIIIDRALEGAPSVLEQQKQDATARIEAMTGHPMVQEIMTAFPGAKIREVRDLTPDLEFLPENEGLDD